MNDDFINIPLRQNNVNSYLKKITLNELNVFFFSFIHLQYNIFYLFIWKRCAIGLLHWWKWLSALTLAYILSHDTRACNLYFNHGNSSANCRATQWLEYSKTNPFWSRGQLVWKIWQSKCIFTREWNKKRKLTLVLPTSFHWKWLRVQDKQVKDVVGFYNLLKTVFVLAHQISFWEKSVIKRCRIHRITLASFLASPEMFISMAWQHCTLIHSFSDDFLHKKSTSDSSGAI